MNGESRLVPFGFGVSPAARDVAELHERLLPRSPVVRLGRHFAEEFYYGILTRRGYIFGAVSHRAATAVGFIACTLDARGFMPAAARRYPLQLARVLSKSLLFAPGRLGVVREVWRIMTERRRVAAVERCGEVLSYGVSAEHRRAASGHSIAEELTRYAFSVFEAHGVREVHAIVDTDNAASRRFLERLGWRLTRTQVPGWATPSIEYVWRPGEQLSDGHDFQQPTG